MTETTPVPQRDVEHALARVDTPARFTKPGGSGNGRDRFQRREMRPTLFLRSFERVSKDPYRIFSC